MLKQSYYSDQRVTDCFKEKLFADITCNNVLNAFYVQTKTIFGKKIMYK